MPLPLRWLATPFLALCGQLPTLATAAEPPPATVVASGVSFQAIGHWGVDKLNEILNTEAPQFFGTRVDYTPAQYGVQLYRVSYPSVIPERGNQPITATGLLAIPDHDATVLPMLSYQHGTVYGKQQVPSFPEQSGETQLALAQFAGQGYVVIGADYFGMGDSLEPEGYLVKGSHQQATYDMLMASRAVLAHLQRDTSKLFLGGWSQGGFVTMALLEKLQSAGVPVAATATASAPMDAFLALNGFLSFPRSNDASWTNVLFILSSFSFEQYYGVPGLARSLFQDSVYDAVRQVYDRDSRADFEKLPTDLHQLLRPEYFNPEFFAASAYGRLLKERTEVYRWVVQSPVRNYYGEQDEVITPGQARLAMTYQQAMGAGNPLVEAITTGATDHRGTYATAVPRWKAWFDQM